MFRWLKRLFSGPAALRAPSAHMPAQAHRDDPCACLVDELALEAAPAPSGRVDRASMPPVSFEQLDHINRAWNAWLFDSHDQHGLDVNDTESRVLEALEAILSSQQ